MTQLGVTESTEKTDGPSQSMDGLGPTRPEEDAAPRDLAFPAQLACCDPPSHWPIRGRSGAKFGCCQNRSKTRPDSMGSHSPATRDYPGLGTFLPA